MNKVEIFEKERATGYNQFVETWIPNYNYFLDCLPKIFNNPVNNDLLVVGCGTGNEIERFVQHPNHWIITGVDPSPDMINQASERFTNNNQVRLIQGLVNELDIKYNAATLLLVLHFLEDDGNKLSLLKDIANRLFAGSQLVILDITGNKNQIVENLKILKHLLPDGIHEDEINKRLDRIENELFAVSEERLAELLIESGFEKPTRFFQSAIYMGWITTKK